MNKSLRPIILIALLFLFVGVVARWPHGHGAGHELVPWRKDFATAQAEALRLHKPMLLDFMATWCGPCQEMAATTWSDPKAAAALQNWIPVRIDIDQNHELASRYSINVVPTLVLLDDKGTVITFSEGAMNPDEFLAWIRGKRSL